MAGDATMTKYNDSDSRASAPTKKFLNDSGLSHVFSLITSFVRNYASPKSHNHDGVYAKSSHTHTTSQVTGLDSALAGKAPSSHTHAISNITNLQAQLDSKQPKGSYAASSHTHTISNVTNLQTELDKKQVKIQPVTTAGTGSAYTATVPHISTLVAGATFTMVPHVVSAAVSPTLNVNNLGAKPIRQRLSNSTLSTAPGATANWLAAGKPVDVMYDGQFWVVDFVCPNLASAYGVLPVSKVSGLDDALSGKLSLKDIETSVGSVTGYSPGNGIAQQGKLYVSGTGFVAVKNAFALLFIKELHLSVKVTPFEGYFGTIEIPGEYKKLAFSSLGNDKIIKFSNPTISGEGTSWAETNINVETEKSMSLNDSFVYNDVLIALAK